MIKPFKEQLETHRPFNEGALMVEKRYHSGKKAKIGEIPLFGFLANDESDSVTMVMIHQEDLDKYEIIDSTNNPPVIKLK